MITIVCDNIKDLDDANELVKRAFTLGIKLNLENSIDDAFWRVKVKNYIEDKYPDLSEKDKEFNIDVATRMMKFSKDAINEKAIGTICDLACEGYSTNNML